MTTPDTAPRTPSSTGLADRLARWLLPAAVMIAAIVLWDRIVVWNAIPPYILPGPMLVAKTLIADWPVLSVALGNTLIITVLALIVAIIGGVGLAILFSHSKWVEYSFFPFAVVLQVTPIVAVFPLINIYVDDATTKLLLCAWIVAFFPILSNTTLGLNSADYNLRDLFELYGASRWQTLLLLRLPAAMPYFFGGLRIAGGLALIGAVVAEFVAGASGFGSGLAFRIIESGYRLNIPRLFAAVILVSVTGIIIYLLLNAVSHYVLRRWHESAADRQR
ncbi:MAG: ABC transporter ATP-binding protein [Hyphomicrobiales bacterium]|nr:MAG: ABC transporter ATP-binding protein [Hyphomicrobiales bacterium]